MAGGEGAKERRRLKRLAEGNKGVLLDDKKNSRENNDTKSKDFSSRQHEHNGRRFNKNEKKNNKAKLYTKSNSAPAKKKVNKPKHLKRKLGQASKESEEAVEIINKEMQEWESKKEMLSKIHNKSNKRQRTIEQQAKAVSRPQQYGDSENAETKSTNHDEKVIDMIENEVVTKLNDKDDGDGASDSFKRKEVRPNNKGKSNDKDDGDGASDSFKRKEARPNNKVKELSERDVDNITAETKSTNDDEIDIDMIENKAVTKSNDKDDGDGASDSSNRKEARLNNNKGNETSEKKTEEEETVTTKSDNEQDSQNEEDVAKNKGEELCSDEDDSEDDNEEPVQRRQRGRRRRGRQDTAKEIEERKAIEKVNSAVSSDNHHSSDNNIDNKSIVDSTKKRYCLGRKPVSDFIVGQSCPAEVVYVKSFGVFFDIGCHSDAFCHVSRLCDDFVESSESMFKEGDKVPKVRVVEIDRRRKRITISLQSGSKIQDERESIDARRKRKDSRRLKSKKNGGRSQFQLSTTEKNENNSSGNRPVSRNDEIVSIVKEPVVNRAPAPMKRNDDLSMMMPVDLKRARKLARRAERRANAEKEAQES